MNQRVLLWLCVLGLLQALHTPSHKQTITLASLQTQRTQLESQIKAIGSTIASLTPAPTNTNNAFQLSDPLISQFQTSPILSTAKFSTTACQQISSQQSQSLTQQITASKSNIATIAAGLATLKSTAETNALATDLTNDNAFLDGISKALASNCAQSVSLANSVLQSNLLAKQWITGNQTIASLHQAYYNRTKLFKNINNCPIATPFFDGTKCIAVTAPQVFNILTQTVESCPQDTSFDSASHSCLSIPYVSNLTGLNNVVYDNKTAIPLPNATQFFCPATRPFYNGVNCISCDLPQYWSVASKSCLTCKSPLVYDVNLDTCVTASTSLTNLNSTWVTENSNVSAVIEQRAALLASSKTPPPICPITTPYYDGVTCISCPYEFNIDTNLCSTAPKANAYDPNLHTYLPVQTNVETLPTANNYTTSTPLKDTAVTNCPAAAPYFDGVACIDCPSIAPIFNADNKTCINCPPTQFYNDTAHICQNKSIVLVSSNVANLMATPTESLAAYNASVAALLTNPNVIVQSCPNPTDYSNGTHCFTCKPTQYFNVETRSCANCSTHLNNKTGICEPVITMLTNLNTAPDLVLPANTTLTALKTAQTSITGTTAFCNASFPYAAANNTCIQCTAPTPYFDLKTQKCAALPPGELYNSSTMSFIPIPQPISNYTAATNYIQSGNATAAADTAKALASGAPLDYCPSVTPYYNGTACVACANAYFDIATHSCVPQCPANTTYQPATKTCNHTAIITSPTATNYIASPNATLASATNTSSLPTDTVVIVCNSTAPFSNGTACISCTAPLYFDLASKACTACSNNTVYQAATKTCNQTAIITSPSATNYIVSPNVTLASVTNTSALPPGTVAIVCNSTAPFSNGTACISCTAPLYFDLASKTCMACPNNTVYQAATKTCNNTAIITSPSATNYIASPNATLASVTNTSALPPGTVAIVCNSTAPFSTGTACISCTAPMHFDLASKTCMACPVNTVYSTALFKCVVPQPITNANASNYIEVGNNTMSNEVSPAQFPPNTILSPCPIATPFYTGTACIACSAPTPYFNLSSNLCVACPAGSTYSPNSCKALPATTTTYSNLQNPNWITNSPQSTVVVKNTTDTLANTPGTVECPLTTPFFNSALQKCVSCPTGAVFNFDTNQCVNCVAPNTVNALTKVCQALPTTYYQTSLTSPSLIYNGQSKVQYTDTYAANLAAHPTTKDCPPATPYYNGVTCISCPPTAPYFNMYLLVCQKCVAPNLYSGNECVPAPDPSIVTTSPDIAKMYSTIF